jgi:hypothetical protein
VLLALPDGLSVLLCKGEGLPDRPFGAAQGPESVEGADSAKAALGYDGWEVALTSAPGNRGEDDAPAVGLVYG